MCFYRGGPGSDCDGDSDSNDENNWRNEYPDEEDDDENNEFAYDEEYDDDEDFGLGRKMRLDSDEGEGSSVRPPKTVIATLMTILAAHSIRKLTKVRLPLTGMGPSLFRAVEQNLHLRPAWLKLKM